MSLLLEDALSGSSNCINCGQPAAKHMEISQLAPVDYYRCNRCSHVWATQKGTSLLLEHLSIPHAPTLVAAIKPIA